MILRLLGLRPPAAGRHNARRVGTISGPGVARLVSEALPAPALLTLDRRMQLAPRPRCAACEGPVIGGHCVGCGRPSDG